MSIRRSSRTVVSVTGTLSSDHDQIDATTVQILLPSISGRVTGVSGTTISITTFDGTAKNLTTDSSTVFRDESGTTTIAAVAKGDLWAFRRTRHGKLRFCDGHTSEASMIFQAQGSFRRTGGFGGQGGFVRCMPGRSSLERHGTWDGRGQMAVDTPARLP